jgi:hypothetical protein
MLQHKTACASKGTSVQKTKSGGGTMSAPSTANINQLANPTRTLDLTWMSRKDY